MLDACSQAEFHSSQRGHRRGEFPALKVAHAFAVIAKFSVACFEGEPQPEARTIPAVPNVSPRYKRVAVNVCPLLFEIRRLLPSCAIVRRSIIPILLQSTITVPFAQVHLLRPTCDQQGLMRGVSRNDSPGMHNDLGELFGESAIGIERTTLGSRESRIDPNVRISARVVRVIRFPPPVNAKDADELVSPPAAD
jgi:hypothetical protein